MLYGDSEVLPYFSQDHTIREAIATSSLVKGKMRAITSGANDALADLPKLPQEGGTVSHLQCGSRSSPSARVAEDCNSYALGAARRLPTSFQDCQGKRNSPGLGSGRSVLLKQERSHYELLITISTVKDWVRTEDTICTVLILILCCLQ